MKLKFLVCVLAGSAGYVLGILSPASERRTTEAGDGSPFSTHEGSTRHSGTNDSSDFSLGTALSELRQPSNDLHALAVLGEVIGQLDSRQIGQLLDVLDQGAAQRFDDRPAWLFKQWLKRDPAAAMAWLRPKLDALAQDGPMSFIFESEARGKLVRAWAEADPQSAFDYARAHPQSGLAIELLSKVMSMWKDRGDEARIALLADFPPGKARTVALQRLHSDWAKRDPVAAFTSARAILQGSAQERTINNVLIAWSEKDAAAAFAQYRALGLNDSALLSRLLAGSAAKNPMQALGWLQQLDASQFGRCAPRVVESWAQRDPAAALGWALANGVRISSQPDNSIRIEHRGLERSTVSTMTSVNPIADAFKSKPDETLAWVRSLPPGPERDRVTELAVQACSTREQALELFKTLPPDAAARVARWMSYRRFSDAPERGREWAMSLPEGPVRTAALTGVGALPGGDMDLPPGPDRDAFLSGTLNRVNGASSEQDAADKLAIIEQIGDPVLRRDLLDETMERYVRLSFRTKEARAALESANVPEEWKRRWLEALSKTK